MEVGVQDVAEPAATKRTITLVKPTSGWRLVDLGELWSYRELLYFLTWRDIKVRYKQTALGALWAVIQPVLLMVVFTVVFGNVARLTSHGIPYPVFTLAALVPWMLFSQSLAAASQSLVGSANLITKVYFPRIVVPLASAGSFAVDFIIQVLILAAVMVYYGIEPSLRILWLPVVAFFALVAALSAGVWLAALNVRYRDVRYAVPFLIQLLLFASPIAYSSSEVQGPWRIAYGLNPMTGIAEGFRWSLFENNPPPGNLALASTGGVLLLLITGLLYFRRTERSFADVI